MLFGEGDAFVVDQAGVLDGVDAGADGVLDGLRAVGVGGYFATELVGFFGDGLQLFEGELRRAGLVALAESTPPEAQILMTSAPYLTTSRTLARAAQGPSATPSAL